MGLKPEAFGKANVGWRLREPKMGSSDEEHESLRLVDMSVKALERDSRLLCGLKVEVSWRFMELKLSSSDEEHDSSRLIEIAVETLARDSRRLMGLRTISSVNADASWFFLE